MEKPSLMMAGATMHVETDALRGQAVGSVIRVTGRVLGMDLLVEEAVSERIPPVRKTWETRGEPQLLVIGAYQMGFSIKPKGDVSHLTVLINYQLPRRGLARLLGRLASRPYAAWCTSRMANDAASFLQQGHARRHDLTERGKSGKTFVAQLCAVPGDSRHGKSPIRVSFDFR